MLEIEELAELLDSIHEKIDSEIILANRIGEDELEKILKKYNFKFSLKASYSYIDLNTSKILIVGQLNIKIKDIEGICRKLNIDSERIDYVSYDEATNYNFERLRFSNKYSDVIFGATPHKGTGIGENSSIITMLESNPQEYPNVVRAMDSNELKLTKTSLKMALTKTQVYLKS